jgi:tetratricopeptide (TPR) repeat protein
VRARAALWRWVLAGLLAAALAAQLAAARDRFRATRILRSVELRTEQMVASGAADSRALRAHLLALEDAARLDPAEVGIAISRGNQYLLLGATESAVEAYRAAQRLERRPETHLNLGEALLRLGRREEALAELAWAMRLDPTLRARIPDALRDEIRSRAR